MAKKDKQALAAKKRRKEKEKQQAIQKKENTKKVLKISLIAFIALCVVVALIFIVITIVNNSGAKIRSQVYLKTEHFSVDGAMMQYFVNDSYVSFKEYYGTYLSQFFDTSKDLKQQACIYATEDMGSGNCTWFDFFVADAENSAKNILKACELAYSNNISLTDEDMAAINLRAKETDVSSIGNGVTTSDVANCLKLQILAYKCITEVTKDIDVTDEEINDYYLESRDEYDYVEYMSVVYAYAEENKAKIDARVEALTNASSKEEFVELLRKYYTLDGTLDVDAAIDNSTDKVTKTDNDLSDEVEEWLFSSSVNDSKSFVSENADDANSDKMTVYFITSEAAPDESPTKSVRHILFDSTTYGSQEKAEELANTIYEKLKANNTKEYFIELACAYSSDQGSVFQGGLYKNVKENTLVKSFNDWTYAPKRLPGSTDLLSSTYGWHIVYFEGEGLPAYKGDIYNAIYQNKYDELVNGLFDTVTIDRNPKVINDMKGTLK